jgi:plasmid maintenance system antidote protein VapI
MITTLKKSTPKKIEDYLNEKGIKQIWLAKKVGISTSHLCNIFAERYVLTEDVLQRINAVLGTYYKI